MARSRGIPWICVALSAFASLPEATGQAEQSRPEAEETVIVVRPGDDPEEVIGSALAGVTSVEVAGEVVEDGTLAKLTVTIGLFARGTGPHRVPIGLDGLYPREAVADGSQLAWEASPPDGWFVILPAAGPAGRQWSVRIDVVAPVRSMDDRRGLNLTVPVAQQRRFRLDLPGAVAEASLADGSPLPVEPIDEGRRSRIEAMLDSRSELAVTWLPRRDESPPLPPLLTGGGHIAIEVTDGALVARSTWEIQVRRGEAAAVTLLPHPDDELEDVEVEGRPVIPEPLGDSRARLIPFPRALRKGDSIRIAVCSRRRIAPPESGADLTRVVFEGHRFEGLVEQGGTLSISRADGLRILADPGPGLRRVDPRDLREEIARTRPTISSAFRFADQPFDLALRVGPIPPLVRVAQRSLAVLEPDGAGARIECWLDYRSVRGQLFAVRVEVPEGLEVDRIGPPEAIASWDLVASGGQDREPGRDEAKAPRTIELVLASALREGQAGPLRIELSGRARFGAAGPGPAPLPLFRPAGAAFDGGKLAVTAPPDLDVTTAEASQDDGAALPPSESPPVTEPGPWSRASAEVARIAFWLRHEGPIDAVPLAIAPRAASASSVIDQLVRVSRDGVDVQQDLTLYARAGDLNRVDLAIPPELERSWELVDRGVVSQYEPIPPGPDGQPIRRLTLAQSTAGSPLKVRISYRVPGVDRLTPGRAEPLEIPRIEVLEPREASPPRVEIAADPAIDLRTEGEGWRRPAENQWVTNPEGGPPLPIREVWIRPPSSAPGDRPRLWATASRPAGLPEALASRAWIRTEQGTDGGVRTSAWYRFDDHGPALGFRLPAGAELGRVYLDGEPVPADDLDALDRPDSYLVRLPAEASQSVLLGLSYRVPGDAASERWQPPTLLDGGRVLETLWEVRVPWSRALVGVPSAFTDENVWYWGGYVWKRRPGMGPSELASWVAGPGTPVDALAPPLTGGRNGDHGYLFGRPGDPEPLMPRIVPRAALVGGCSGVVLLFGLLALVRNPLLHRALPVAVLALLGGLVAIGQSTAILALQSSAIGWLLVAVAVLTRRAVDRRPVARFDEQSGRGPSLSGVAGAPGVTPAEATPLVGSDDSTAIRSRPVPADRPPSSAQTPHPMPGSSRREDVFDLHAPRADREAS